jgi:4-amino-4-deoxy-L-arabinose transferase-like glycosyltransferase
MTFGKAISFLGAHKLLIGLILIAFFLRAVDINNNPKALYGDELTLSYDTYSILKTGHDSTGALLPLTFKTGEGRPGGYIYGSMPFEAVFGPTAVGIRSLSILSGVGIVLLMFFLGKALFNGEVGLIAAGFTTFSPWDISIGNYCFSPNFYRGIREPFSGD